jgi:glycoside hydrolase-like protein
MSVFGVDYAWGRPGTAALVRAGVKFVCRYLSHDTTGKNLTLSEARQLTSAGIWIVVVWESTAQRALGGRAAGAADAKAARQQADSSGMPAGRPIYFAVDFDAGAGQQAAINSYLDGAADVFGRDRVGLYAGYYVIKRAFDAKKITWGWQTYAWSGGHWDGRAQLQQYSNNHKINGAGVDYDRAVKDDYGQWRVGTVPEEEDGSLKLLISLGATEPLEVAPGDRASVPFNAEYHDADKVHTDGSHPSWFPKESAYYLTTVDVVVNAPAPGAKFKVIFAEYERDSNDHVKDLLGEDKIGAGTAIEYTLTGLTWQSSDRKYRVDVTNFGTEPVTVTKAYLKVAR